MGNIIQFTVAEGTEVPFSVAGDREVRITVWDMAGAKAFGSIRMESAPQDQSFYVLANQVGITDTQTIITLNRGEGKRYVYRAISGDQLLMVWED